MIAICKNPKCGKRFKKLKNQRYCDVLCRREVSNDLRAMEPNTLLDHIRDYAHGRCEVCDEPLTRRQEKYCSRRCYGQAQSQARPISMGMNSGVRPSSKGERALWRQCLIEAVQCSRGVLTGDMCEKTSDTQRRRLIAEAWNWFARSTTGVGTFLWICDILDLDSSTIRLAVASNRSLISSPELVVRRPKIHYTMNGHGDQWSATRGEISKRLARLWDKTSDVFGEAGTNG